MRLAKERVHHMAESLIARLHELQFLAVTGDRKSLRESLELAITQELGVEDRLNAEVRRLMGAPTNDKLSRAKWTTRRCSR